MEASVVRSTTVGDLLERARRRGEMLTAAGRALFCILVLARFAFMPSGSQSPAEWTVLALTAVAAGWFLWRTARSTVSEGFVCASVAFDALGCFSALVPNVLWPSDHYEGFLLMPDTAALLLVTAASGARLSPRAAVLGAALNALSASTLIALDASLNAGRLHYGAGEATIFFIILLCLGGFTAGLGRQTLALATAAAQLNQRNERASQSLVDLLREHHDVRSGLSSARLNADLLSRSVGETASDRAARSAVDRLQEDLAEVESLVTQVRDRAYAELAALQGPAPAPVLATVRAATRAVERRFPLVRVLVEAEGEAAGAEAMVVGGGASLLRVVLNLLVNSCEGDGQRGAREIAVRVEWLPDNERLVLRVTDDGPGLHAGCFGPLGAVTTKAEGAGFGVLLVRSLVESSGGTFSLENRSEGGAEARVELSGRPGRPDEVDPTRSDQHAELSGVRGGPGLGLLSEGAGRSALLARGPSLFALGSEIGEGPLAFERLELAARDIGLTEQALGPNDAPCERRRRDRPAVRRRRRSGRYHHRHRAERRPPGRVMPPQLVGLVDQIGPGPRVEPQRGDEPLARRHARSPEDLRGFRLTRRRALTPASLFDRGDRHTVELDHTPFGVPELDALLYDPVGAERGYARLALAQQERDAAAPRAGRKVGELDARSSAGPTPVRELNFGLDQHVRIVVTLLAPGVTMGRRRRTAAASLAVAVGPAHRPNAAAPGPRVDDARAQLVCVDRIWQGPRLDDGDGLGGAAPHPIRRHLRHVRRARRPEGDHVDGLEGPLGREPTSQRHTCAWRLTDEHPPHRVVDLGLETNRDQVLFSLADLGLLDFDRFDRRGARDRPSRLGVRRRLGRGRAHRGLQGAGGRRFGSTRPELAPAEEQRGRRAEGESGEGDRATLPRTGAPQQGRVDMSAGLSSATLVRHGLASQRAPLSAA